MTHRNTVGRGTLVSLTWLVVVIGACQVADVVGDSSTAPSPPYMTSTSTTTGVTTARDTQTTYALPPGRSWEEFAPEVVAWTEGPDIDDAEPSLRQGGLLIPYQQGIYIAPFVGESSYLDLATPGSSAEAASVTAAWATVHGLVFETEGPDAVYLLRSQSESPERILTGDDGGDLTAMGVIGDRLFYLVDALGPGAWQVREISLASGEERELFDSAFYPGGSPPNIDARSMATNGEVLVVQKFKSHGFLLGPVCNWFEVVSISDHSLASDNPRPAPDCIYGPTSRGFLSQPFLTADSLYWIEEKSNMGDGLAFVNAFNFENKAEGSTSMTKVPFRHPKYRLLRSVWANPLGAVAFVARPSLQDQPIVFVGRPEASGFQFYATRHMAELVNVPTEARVSVFMAPLWGAP